MDDPLRVAVRRAVGGSDAFYVGGCLRDLHLGRVVHDVDIACPEPEAAARAFRDQAGEAVFELSTRHGAWRVVVDGGPTVDFVAMRGSIEEDLTQRDFTVNAIAQHVHTGAEVDPSGGLDDLERGVLRAVSDTVFVDDALRLLRAVRLEDELPLALEPHTEALVREHASAVARPAGERVLAELQRLGAAGFARLDQLGLLEHLGGSAARLGHVGEDPDTELLLVATLGARLLELPISRELARMTRTLLRAEPLAGHDPRSVHRFRRATEPWAVDALRFLGDVEGIAPVRAARERDPAAPLLRGDELGIAPGPEVGRLLALVEEERAAGTIATRDEALALVTRHRT